jgi:hypothetical protein
LVIRAHVLIFGTSLLDIIYFTLIRGLITA